MSDQHKVTLRVFNRFDPDIESLRVAHYHERLSPDPFADEFDATSHFVAAYYEGEAPIGVVRMTPGPDLPIHKWSRGQNPLPTGAGVVDMNRGVVHRLWRKSGLLRLLMAEALLYSVDQGFEHAVAALKVDTILLPMLQRLGFSSMGEPVWCYHQDHDRKLCHMMLAQPANHVDEYRFVQANMLRHLERAGIAINREEVPETGRRVA